MNRTVTVVIVNWNNWQDTLTCLANLDRLDLSGVNLKTVIVDNGSEDDSLNHLQDIADVVLLTLAENAGFAAGSNVGIRHALDAGSDYVLLLNNDAYGAADFLIKMLRSFEDHGACGVVCPKIRYADGSDGDAPRIWYAGGRFRQPRLIGEMVGMGEIDAGQHDRAQVVDFAVGCCMLIDARLFSTVGLFDEDFFFYQEDVDFSYRATLANFEVWYQPAALVWHHVSRSTEDDLPHRTYLYASSRPVFFVKHIRGIQWLPVLALEAIRLVRTVLTALMQRHPAQAWAYTRGTASGWRHALHVRRGRQGSAAGSDR